VIRRSRPSELNQPDIAIVTVCDEDPASLVVDGEAQGRAKLGLPCWGPRGGRLWATPRQANEDHAVAATSMRERDGEEGRIEPSGDLPMSLHLRRGAPVDEANARFPLHRGRVDIAGERLVRRRCGAVALPHGAFERV
jgi:hypothetical protein